MLHERLMCQFIETVYAMVNGPESTTSPANFLGHCELDSVDQRFLYLATNLDVLYNEVLLKHGKG